ncbi:prephenate dehydrogenase/arogenate dehydrogenase family protein [Alteromonas sp. 345S023]|uniref:Prephenate dehydrogenase/arogenate dehydrogenase family protein n=1 Tax=Alteromonas profundi TaxID=2696062 RepID=A0A7X5LNM8_9ALTE|nr:NAD(P)-dependent oxidoreductase [Alteromonas profundi]NDV92722.1 prephenate dehydrogenase/arogenate dehydrogenase family protein [Alteromonas profundi]
MTQLKVSFLGLGVMGYPMAGHLASAGFDVTVFNRTTEKAQRWAAQYKGAAVSTPAQAAEDADVVLMCVGDDNDVRAVAKEAIAVMKEGAVLVDHTTASAQVAKEVYALCKDNGLGFLDAPVSGGQAGAENGQLTIMVGGDKTDYETALPVISAYARHSQLLGECGAGQLAKMMNQICIAGVIQGLAEALHFGQKAGLDCTSVIDVISKGAAQSWQMENRAHTMLDNTYDFGFAVDWMRKDLSIALDEARRNGSTLALTALVDQYYADIQKVGGGRWDTSSLLTRLK